VEPFEGPLQVTTGPPGLRQQRDELLTFEGDGCALGVVLVIGVGGLGRFEHLGQFELETLDVLCVVSHAFVQLLGRVHLNRNGRRTATLPQRVDADPVKAARPVSTSCAGKTSSRRVPEARVLNQVSSAPARLR